MGMHCSKCDCDGEWDPKYCWNCKQIAEWEKERDALKAKLETAREALKWAVDVFEGKRGLKYEIPATYDKLKSALLKLSEIGRGL